MNNKTSSYIVLIVDDDVDTVSMLNDMLDAAGFTTLVALEGMQAIQIAAHITPHIILMDALMPNMDGFETCRHLHKNPLLQHVPIIFMTGLNESQHVVNAFDAGVVDYIVKPINQVELLARMRTHINNSRLTASALSVLDAAGRLTIAVDPRGELIWATPLALRLLQSCDGEDNRISFSLRGALERWLALKSGLSAPLTYKKNGCMLRFHFIENKDNNEFILRMEKVDSGEKQHVAQINLRKAFQLTEREAEILFWLSRGKKNQEIGLILSLSARTIDKHIENIYRKMNVSSRTLATMLCLPFIDV